MSQARAEKYITSAMARVNLNELDLLSLTITIGCKLVSFSFDLPKPAPNADPKSSSIWDPVVERFRSGRSYLYLSFGGLITIIKSTLANLLIVYLSLFKICVKLPRDIEWIRTDLVN